MSFAIIFNKDTLFSLSTAQKKALDHLNSDGASFKPCYPLWCNLEKEEKITSLKIDSLVLRENYLSFPITIETQDGEKHFFVNAGERFRGNEQNKKSLPVSEGFPIMPRVFRIAETVSIGENCFGTQKSKWVKLKR